jgi:dihydrofolate synthase / folylpolyglutamate synthase
VPDHAVSSDPAVQAQLDRLARLSPGADVLGLERIATLCARLGHPERALPPVFHVAGTNGKGSTCAFLRAALEAAGHRVHVYASPHLVRFNERIRLAGRLVDDAPLAAALAEVLDVADGVGASFFEVTTAAAFLLFARTPADAAVVEVGLGGRLDATNVLPAPAACGIAALGLDHQAFLGDTLAGIAREKAGIAKPGVPLVTMAYPAPLAAEVQAVAEAAGAPVLPRGVAWTGEVRGDRLRYRDAGGALDLPLPALPGPHQADNLALATAMLRHQTALAVPEAALAAAAIHARWPARLQRLSPGPLAARVAPRPLYLDGAHNPSAAAAVAAWWRSVVEGAPSALVLGVLANKDAAGVLDAFAAVPGLSLVAVPVPGHPDHPPAALAALAAARGMAAATAADLTEALSAVPDDAAKVLIAGSLYLAGEALRLNDEAPE